MKTPLLMLAMLAVPDAAFADPSTADTKLVDLAFHTCLSYPDNPERLKFHLDANLPVAGEKSEAFFLGRNAGKVWLAHDGAMNFAVVMFDSGRCAVEGDTVSIDGVMQAFAAHVAAEKMPLQRTADDPKGDFRGAPGHTQVYEWTYGGHAYRVALGGTPVPKALVHAEISLDPPPPS